MYLLFLILILAGGLLAYLFIRIIVREIETHRIQMAYRNYIMVFGTEAEKESLLMNDMEDMLLGITGLVMLDMADGDLDGEIYFW